MKGKKQTRPVADKAGGSQVGKDRYALIKAGLDQYKMAMNNGYYIEAIALMESLISDRMESTLNYLYPYSNYSYETLAWLADSLMKTNCFSKELLEKIKDWSKERNSAIHQMMKLLPGNNKSFQERHSELERCAEKGHELFKKLNDEKEKLKGYQEKHPLIYKLKEKCKDVVAYPETLRIKCKVADVAKMLDNKLFDESSYFEDENGILWRKQLLDMYYDLEKS